MGKTKIFFRADGSSQIGLGHVFRCLSLAELLRDDFESMFLIQNPSVKIGKLILETCSKLIELPSSQNLEEEAQFILQNYIPEDSIVVLDGYHFSHSYHRQIKEHPNHLVCIDDIPGKHMVADVVINHAPGIQPNAYSHEPYTQLCLGLGYSLIRPPFLMTAQQAREIDKLETVFICFGGSDPHNLTVKVLTLLLEQVPELQTFHAVIGAANVHKDSLLTLSKQIGNNRVYLHENLTATKMCQLLQTCDLAIVPGSSVLFEVAAVKMPIISGYYVDNQIKVYEGFSELNLIYGIGDFRTFDQYRDAIYAIQQKGLTFFVDNQDKSPIRHTPQNLQNLFNSLAIGATKH